MKTRTLAVVAVIVLLSRAAAAQTADNVLLVINDRSPASVQIGEYYAGKRGVAADHIVRLKTGVTEVIARAAYEAQIESPIIDLLSRNALQDRVLYIVLTKGVPLRIAGSEGRSGTMASVDSELTVLYRKLLGLDSVVIGQVPNPYFLDQRPLTEARRFTRFANDIYLVTRLDGYTVDDVRGLIDRGLSPARDGTIVLDQRASAVDTAGGDRRLAEAADRLRRGGYQNPVLLERTAAVVTFGEPVIGYYSWGSNDPANRLRRFGLKFSNGAVGGMFLSTEGRTFIEPRDTWLPGGGKASAGSGPQTLAGDLIRDGITGVAGHVAEPYLNATIRPQILFPSYLAGFNLAEAFYLAMPFLSWQTVVIGDPLCSPFAQNVLTTDEISKGVDSNTKLPALLSERRLEALVRSGLRRDGLELAFRAEVEARLGNSSEVETLLRRATDLEPRLDNAHLSLAETYRARGDHDAAIDRYQRVIANDPRNVAALNNLAYALAVDKQLPRDALPFADRAFRLSPIPLVADTLGWIHHLLGDDASAAPLVERALAGAPNNPDVLVHAAFVHADLNETARATKELDAAEKLNPSLSQRADIKTLRERLTAK
jgi:uncharacterized protein (TIGR03790 family)